MMKKLSFVTLMFVVSAIALHAADPTSPQVTPISWVLQTQHNIDVDDKSVTLVGEVVKRDNGSDWWFSDTTGSVRLDTGDMELPVGRMLVVKGRIDQARFGIGHLEVEVKHWAFADKSR
jgi:uncharacterized protein YdeI (BOF family)